MEKISDIRKKLEDLLTGEIPDNKNIYIWGVGNTSSLYLEGIHRLKSEGFKVKAYVDNNREKWGSTFDDCSVVCPDEVFSDKNSLILISSPQPNVIRAVKNQIESNGAMCMHIDEYILKQHKDEVMEAFDLFEDERSKEVYAELLHCRILGTYPEDEYVDSEAYFSFKDFGDYNPKEVFVDCGAYVGDTIEKYIWRKDGNFGKIIAFEPDEANRNAMEYRLDRLKREWNLSDERITVYPYGLSDKCETLYLDRYDEDNGLGSKLVKNHTDIKEKIEIVSIDELIDKPFDFLKADIESYEYKLLMGGWNNIAKYMPKLAICVYHNVVDFYQIPKLIKRINSKYKLSIRHYTHLLSETVLYAY